MYTQLHIPKMLLLLEHAHATWEWAQGSIVDIVYKSPLASVEQDVRPMRTVVVLSA